MVITNSPSVSNYDFKVVFNLTGVPPISGTTPIPILAGMPYVTISDASTYISPTDVLLNFTLTSPSGIVFYQGDFVSNYIAANGIINLPLPVFNSTVEKGTYKIASQLQDADDTIYNFVDVSGNPYKTVTLCLANNITAYVNNNISSDVAGMQIGISINCQTGYANFSDNTAYNYNGFTASTPYSTSVQFLQPPNQTTGIVPSPSTSSFLPVSFPIVINGIYQLQIINNVTYSFGDNCYAIIAYTYTNNSITVQCNVNPCQIACNYNKIVNDMLSACGNNANAYAAAQKKLIIASAQMINLMAFISCGIGIGDLLDQIAATLGTTCDCLCQPSGITPNVINSPTGSWQLVITGGDLNGSLQQVGNNILLTLGDLHYVVAANQGDGTENLLTVTPTTSGTTTTYTLSLSQLVTALATINTTLAKLTLTWTALVSGYINNWANVGGDTHAGYYSSVDASGNVVLQGLLTTSSALANGATTIITESLPATILPSKPVSFSVTITDSSTGDTYPGVLTIAPYLFVAKLSLYNGSGTSITTPQISLDGISYNIH